MKQRGVSVEIASGLTPLIASAAGRLSLMAIGRGGGDGGERMTKESYATISRNQSSVNFSAERWFRGRCIGSKEGVFGRNTCSNRVLSSSNGFLSRDASISFRFLGTYYRCKTNAR